MGVPAFFRWLSRKYPSIVVQCDDGVKGEYHFDNLYLDMNGIIHPCSHPENKPPPANEEEMFLAIFEYVEDIMRIVKPKKLLYMAVDGVAPRAKMNQQRSRRFRAAQESYEKIIEVQKVKDNLRERGIDVKEKEKEAHFDSNVITPGTQFMINLSEALRTWINRRFSPDYPDKDSIWPKDLVIILSDASVPGEGEHKIMDYIRRQKSDPLFNPNLSHCLYGADADLIMLGLATHELNFTILREEFKPNQPRPCDLCGQLGHELKECTGEEKAPEDLPIPAKTDFIYIRLNVLREYLERESQKCQVKLDFERFIDDYVFLCFFVGNDFLPHLPSLEIRENAIDRLITIYKYVMETQSDPNDMYLTNSGIVNKKRAQLVLLELGEVEDEIFKQRQRKDKNYKERQKRMKLQRMNEDLKWLNPQAVSQCERPGAFRNVKVEASKVRMTYHSDQTGTTTSERIESMLVTKESVPPQDASRGIKRPMEDSDSEPEDHVQLHNEGWKERYYLHKFDCESTSGIGRKVADEYFKGLCWVLLYYYQGCPDWKWFYPYHYAPFASDFQEVENLTVEFDTDAKPFRPLEQLMSVFPAASSSNLPPTWRDLMTNIQSPIIDFYPISFKIDLNGKKAAWMGVALLPFIDEDRLFKALKNVYGDLTEDEKSRNSLGGHLMFVSKSHNILTPLIDDVVTSNKTEEPIASFDAQVKLISGTFTKSVLYSESKYINVSCCEFMDPQYEKQFVFPAIRLKSAIIPTAVLKPNDLSQFDNYRPQIGMNPRGNQAYLDRSGHRMVEHSVPREYRSNYDRNTYHNQYGYDRNSNYRSQDNRYQGQRSQGGGHSYEQRSYYNNNQSTRGTNPNYSNNQSNRGSAPNYNQGNRGNSSYTSNYNQPNYSYYQQQNYPPQQGYRHQQPQPPTQSRNIPSYYTNDYVRPRQNNPNNNNNNRNYNSSSNYRGDQYQQQNNRRY